MAVATIASVQVGAQTSFSTSFVVPTATLLHQTTLLSAPLQPQLESTTPSPSSVVLSDSLLDLPDTSQDPPANRQPQTLVHQCSTSPWFSIAKSVSRLRLSACRWMGRCGGSTRSQTQWREQSEGGVKELYESLHGKADYWTSGLEEPATWSDDEKRRREIPQYVLDYAPYVHLFSGEQFWPCDIAEHLHHITPYANYTPIEGLEDNRDLDNLNELNYHRQDAYLQSNDNVEERPDWLGGAKNIPLNKSGEDSFTRYGGQRILSDPGKQEGYSSAPAILVVIPKEHGVVDAFWFFFYSYNLGKKIFARFGNHVGDWEHTMIRFRDGEPETVFLSEHDFGEAYGFEAVEKRNKRPVVYSAEGSHAMYATEGLHPYVLPLGILHDETDKGPLWDPSLNLYAFTYNLSTSELLSSNQTPKAPVNWFHYRGHWGDKAYPMSDKRQYQFAGQYHYVSGPLGPRYKRLGRDTVCQGRGPCKIRHWLGGSKELELVNESADLDDVRREPEIEDIDDWSRNLGHEKDL